MKKIKLFFTLSFFSIITAGYYNNYSNPPIIVATVCGDLSQVKSYCTASTINTIGNNGQTALMHSCISNSGDIFVFLMENNADFKIKDNFGKTALDYAIEHNRVEMIEYLALSGADTNGLDVDQLLKAAHTQEFITEAGKSNPDLNKIRSCIAAGADLKAKDNYGWTALIKAAEKDHTEIVKLLISAGVDVNAKSDNVCLTALILVAKNGNTEDVKLLLSAGADVNAKSSYYGTALIQAAKNGHTETVKLLLSAGVDVNVKSINCGVGTALIETAYKGHTETVKLLLSAGSDVDIKDDNGCTALMRAAETGHIEIVKLLISAGADLNSKDRYGNTVLLHSTRYYYSNITQRENCRELSKLFIESGADVNARDNDGWTALMRAAINGGTEIVKLLITADADVNIKNNDGKTALMLAKDYNHPEIVKLLEQHAKNKAKVNSTKKAKIISVKKALNKKKNHETN